MPAPPSAKAATLALALLADEAKFKQMTAAAHAKAGGGDSVNEKAGGGESVDEKAVLEVRGLG